MPNKLSIQERFLLFLSKIGDSERVAAKKLGITHGAIGHLKRGGTMGVDKLERALEAYPELNRMWLLEGIGSMSTDEGITYDNEEFDALIASLKSHLPEDHKVLVDKVVLQMELLESEKLELVAELQALMEKLG